MITHGALEHYDERDFAGSDLDFDNIQNPKQAIIEYNQNEFQSGSFYCTAYACFASWSSYTGEEVPEYWRKEFIEYCLETGLIEDGVGGRLNKVVDSFIDYINGKTESNYRYARCDANDLDIHAMGFNIVTGFYGNSSFKKDRQDNCMIDNVDYGTGTWGHAISEYDKSKIQDNYKGRECNLYGVSDFDGYVNSSNHFNSGYFFYLPVNPAMIQFEQDIKDVEEALSLKITNNEQELIDIKMGNYTSDNKTTLKIMRSRRI